MDAFEGAVASLGIDGATLYLSQNDGTLMGASHTRSYPVATFASGPTNSMRGAAFLSGETDCAVIDIGGTTTDVGILRHGFPREAPLAVEIGGIRTNFRMPDLVSIGVGGGSIVREGRDVTVGPDSVGHRLTSRAIVFGGETLTATDVAVAAELATVGNPDRVAGLDTALVREALAVIESQVAGALDRMKTGPDPIPVVLVGGGSIILGDDLTGAVHDSQARTQLRRQRDRRSPGSGGWPCRSNRQLCDRLAPGGAPERDRGSPTTLHRRGSASGLGEGRRPGRGTARLPALQCGASERQDRGRSVMRSMSSDDLASLSLGASFLGAGGGGDPYIGTLMARNALDERGEISVIELLEVPDDAICAMSAVMGAPTVLVEKLPGVNEQIAAFAALERHLGREITHVMCAEVGGLNSTLPIVTAARLGKPLIDCDAMGRAFPEIQMSTPTLYGIGAAPIALADDKGNRVCRSRRSTTIGPSAWPGRSPSTWERRRLSHCSPRPEPR